jgi:hypothetical protein
MNLFYRSILDKSWFTYFEPFLEEVAFIFSISGDFSKILRIYFPLTYGINIKLLYSHIYPFYIILGEHEKFYLMERHVSLLGAADVGFLYNFNNFFSIGLTIRNISSTDFNTSNTFIVIDDVFTTFDPLLIKTFPTNIDIGAKVACKFGFLSFDIRNLIEREVNGEGIKARNWIFEEDRIDRKYIFKRNYHLGLELSVFNPFIIRCGIFCQPRNWQEDESLFGSRTLLKEPIFKEIENKIKIRYIRGFSINVGYKYKDRFEFNVTLENETGDTGTETSPVYDIFYIYNVQGIIKGGIISKYIISCRYLF